MTPPVKGNRKGRRNAHQTRRLLVVGGSALSIVALIILLTNGVSGPYDEGKLKRQDGSLRELEKDKPSIKTDTDHKDDGDPSVDDAGNDGSIDLSATPTLKYGTAWKAERTAHLVRRAINNGFRHVDTACQPKHYNEAGVGEGWKLAASDLGLERKDLWLQTKFTSLNGQDPNRIPYDKNAKLSEQVRQSVSVSLKNLQTDYIDSLVMHGMENSWEKNFEVYRTMEEFVDSGVVKQIGISNFYDFDAVKYLYENVRIKPAVIQNRFYKDSNYDKEIRKFCRDNGIEYQSFWTLTANPHAWRDRTVVRFAQSKGLTPENLFYAFVMELGISPLDGTTNEEHMMEDVALMNYIRSGKKVFEDKEEINIVASALGVWS